MKIPRNRRGFIQKAIVSEVNSSQPIIEKHSSSIVYYENKLSHSGITTYKVFEGYQRKMHKNSLSNLINQVQAIYDGTEPQPLKKDERTLNKKQSRKLKSVANKLCYYSRVRTFVSKKTGSYKFKVGFITLTAPDGTTDRQLLTAFEHFLDYLRRTALCNYVWKKELGEVNKKLHFHIMVNNFIPYYLVSWKWKRLLIAQGVKWEKNEKGEETNSHSRIELPRSRKLVAHYISKYMSKAYSLPREHGYISGYSEVLDSLTDCKFIQGELPADEVLDLQKNYRTIKDVFLTHCCADLRYVQQIAPTIFYWFDKQFKAFQDQLTLPQKYWYV